MEKKKVTGIGGIFFKASDPKKIREWYEANLGIAAADWGAVFPWREKDADKDGYTLWSPFPSESKKFEPSKKDFMVNFRVENLESLVEELKKAGVTLTDELATSDFGKFVHILDPEGNVIELFEPSA